MLGTTYAAFSSDTGGECHSFSFPPKVLCSWVQWWLMTNEKTCIAKIGPNPKRLAISISANSLRLTFKLPLGQIPSPVCFA